MGNKIDELQAFLEKLVVADLFSGAVLIALNGVPIEGLLIANKSFMFQTRSTRSSIWAR